MLPQADDFRAEADALRGLLTTLREADWDRATLFKKWTINTSSNICTTAISWRPRRSPARKISHASGRNVGHCRTKA
jgi:hypothetical protein